ncbi:MAG: AMP-binding protein [Acidimicrobiales bacterium]
MSELSLEDPDALLVSDGSQVLSRADFNTLVNRTMALLDGVGVSSGDRCGILALNSADYMVATVATALMGVDPVPISWHLSQSEVAYILENSRCVGIFVDSEHEATGSEAARSAGVDRVLAMGDRLSDLADGYSADEQPERGFSSPLYFTSGTTGRPKGTQMSQLRSSTTATEFAVDAVTKGVGPATVHLTVGPLYHAGPLTQAIRTVMVGGRLHIMSRFDAEQALALIDEHQITDTICVPIHLVRLLRLPEETRGAYDVSSMQRIFHIAAMMPPDVKRGVIDWFGPVVTDGYGASEVGVVTQIGSEEWLERPGSVGRPIPHMHIEIIGDDDEPVPNGEVGHIFISNDAGLDISYVDDAEKTAAAHRRPGQFTLGDLGWLDDDGYLYLADRRVDLIISGGVNIYPAEVETHLIVHPAVDDVGVFAVPDSEWGHAVKAAVKLRDGYEGTPELEADMQAWLSDRIARYKVPGSIDFVDDMPRFSNGKLHRRELREPYWTGQ